MSYLRCSPNINRSLDRLHPFCEKHLAMRTTFPVPLRLCDNKTHSPGTWKINSNHRNPVLRLERQLNKPASVARINERVSLRACFTVSSNIKSDSDPRSISSLLVMIIGADQVDSAALAIGSFLFRLQRIRSDDWTGRSVWMEDRLNI